MNIILSALSKGTIGSIVITCIVAVAILVFVVLSALNKKGKLNGKISIITDGANNRLQAFGVGVKSRLFNKTPRTILYWVVLVLLFVSAVFGLALEISAGYYSLNFLVNLIYIGFILTMIVFDVSFSPVAPYYYEYKPILFSYSAVKLFFGIIDYCTSLANANYLFSTLNFVGELLFFGVIFITRFAKSEFKPRDLLVYLGSAFLIIVPFVSFVFSIVSFAKNSGSAIDLSVSVINSTISLLANISVTVLLTYFYDRFDFIKRLFKKESM